MHEPNRGVAVLRPGARLLAALLISALAACDDGDPNHRVNGDVHVQAGVAATGANSVNGSITIDDGASFTDANTVNGSITVGAKATGASVRTVNGAVSVSPAAHLSGSVTTVNGGITLQDGVSVAGTITAVNGAIELSGAQVGGGIKSANANILITGDSRVAGGITVEKATNGFVSTSETPPRIVIGPGATVLGELRFERPVKLYVSDHATIGTVVGATAVQFTGDKPAE
jgi:cytoskeletal protein CcmA (bactofilin family)